MIAVRLAVCIAVSLGTFCCMGIAEEAVAPKTVTLSVATYNLKLLPAAGAPFSEKLDVGQRLRTPWIVDYLRGAAFDIVVLQEMLDDGLTEQIMDGIRDAYPYQVAPRREGGSVKLSSGVLIASWLPLEELGHVIFSPIKDMEKLATKDCTLIAAEKDGVKFQLAGTHMLTGKDPRKHVEFTRIREELLTPNAMPGVPQLLLGDMNVTKGTDAYTDMMQRLQMQDFPLQDPRPHTAGDPRNYWNGRKNRDVGHQLDYILLAPNGSPAEIADLYILRPTREHAGEQVDLSDHYGLAASVRLTGS